MPPPKERSTTARETRTVESPIGLERVWTVQILCAPGPRGDEACCTVTDATTVGM